MLERRGPPDSRGDLGRPCALALVLLLAAPCRADWSVWLDHGLKKYRRDGEDGTRGAASLVLQAAKNEFEPFQVLIHGGGEALRDVDVEVGDFVKGSDRVSDVVLYRQHYLHCTNRSRADYETGWYPDALLPKVDRYFGERRSSFPFDVGEGKVQGVWVDVGTTPATPAGTYESTVTVSAAGKSPRRLAVRLVVRDFVLPATATYPSIFYLESSYIHYGHKGTFEWDTPWLTEATRLYNRCALYHRIGTQASGAVMTRHRWDARAKRLSIASWNPWLEIYREAFDGEAIPTGPYAGATMRATTVPNTWNLVNRDGAIALPDKPLAQRRYLEAWFDLFAARGWDPMARLFVGVEDEPNGSTASWRGRSMTDYEVCVEQAREVAAVPTGGRGPWRNVFVNKHNVPELKEFDELGFYDPWVGHYVCDGWERTGNPDCAYRFPRERYAGYPNDDMRHWAYLSCMNNGCNATGGRTTAGQIDWSVDAPATINRLWSFVFWHYEVKGLLYWGLNVDNAASRAKAPFESVWYYGSNGDGHLIYPGVASRDGRRLPPSTPAIGGAHDIPIESIRLKHIREGMEDLEYLRLAAARAGKAAADACADTVFTTTAFPPGAYWSLRTDPEAILAARERIVELIVRTSARGSGGRTTSGRR